ncbi:MAG: GIY-YIG nuclease family protein [Candidatus Berkelbacteria bacterium]
MKKYFVYILASRLNGTLYVGVTSNLEKRTNEHKDKITNGFSEKYGAKKLVYFEETSDVTEAILREKRLKKWNRVWKIKLIEQSNPGWKDLLE